MFTDPEMHRLFEAMFERMLKAGWVESFRFTVGKGWWVNWRAKGADRAASARLIAETCLSGKSAAEPIALAVFSKGIHFPGVAFDGEPDMTLATFWWECGEDLGLSSGSEDQWLVFFHVVTGWGPKS
jgi:hypothetical protein